MPITSPAACGLPCFPHVPVCPAVSEMLMVRSNPEFTLPILPHLSTSNLQIK